MVGIRYFSHLAVTVKYNFWSKILQWRYLCKNLIKVLRQFSKKLTVNGHLKPSTPPLLQECNNKVFVSQLCKVKFFYPHRGRFWKGPNMTILGHFQAFIINVCFLKTLNTIVDAEMVLWSGEKLFRIWKNSHNPDAAHVLDRGNFNEELHEFCTLLANNHPICLYVRLTKLVSALYFIG